MTIEMTLLRQCAMMILCVHYCLYVMRKHMEAFAIHDCNMIQVVNKGIQSFAKALLNTHHMTSY